MITSAYPGVRAVYRDLIGSGDDIFYSVLVWKDEPKLPADPKAFSDSQVIGLVLSPTIAPNSPYLIEAHAAPIPDGYQFIGYSYCCP